MIEPVESNAKTFMKPNMTGSLTVVLTQNMIIHINQQADISWISAAEICS